MVGVEILTTGIVQKFKADLVAVRTLIHAEIHSILDVVVHPALGSDSVGAHRRKARNSDERETVIREGESGIPGINANRSRIEALILCGGGLPEAVPAT